MITQKDVEKVLKDIPDPEIGVSLWDLGLIYSIEINNKTGNVEILMTLTSIGCPLFEEMEGQIRKEVRKLKGVKHVGVTLTFEPPWTPERMKKNIWQELQNK